MQYKALLGAFVSSMVVVSWLAVSLVGCTESKVEPATMDAVTVSRGQVLAKVGDWEVTEEELSQVAQDILGGNAANPLLAKSEDKLLQSLIVSKAIPVAF